jgi:hypothetical protein
MASNDRRDEARKEQAPAPKKQNGGEATPPVYSHRYWTGSGHVDVAVFSHVSESDGGPRFTTYSTLLKCSYKDGDEYTETRFFRPEDLLVAAHALQQAYAFIASHPQKG